MLSINVREFVGLVLLLLTFVSGCAADGKPSLATRNDGSGGDRQDSNSCYSPCKQGFTDAKGNYRACSADGLMAGCIDGRVCSAGTCLKEGEAEPADCSADMDCPEFQRCGADGRCQAECDGNSDCGAGQGCSRRVCRELCKSTEDTCAEGSFCALVDAQNGFCEEIAPVTSASVLAGEGTYALSASLLAFTNTQTKQTLEVTNNSPRALTFTLRKLDQRTFTAAGPVDETREPLPFLALGAQGTTKKQKELSLSIESGATGRFEIEIAQGDADDVPTQWRGTLEVVNDELGSQRVALKYSRSADGRWLGKAYYFTQFGEKNLDAWMARRDDARITQSVGNAFIKKWADLRLGRIAFDELEAVITSTIAESWRWPSIQRECSKQGHQRCYPNQTGIGVYSEDPNTAPIPAGLVELPMAMDLATSDSALRLTGRIPSREALHYAGDPAVELDFEADPSQCASGNRQVCLAFLSKLSSTVVVGGRYAASLDDTECERAASGFKATSIPSLVPGFSAGTELDEKSGNRYRTECRDSLQPFDLQGPQASLNSSLAGANPVPDGRSRVRSLELVDGALINQEYMYVIFRERFASFLGPTDDAGFASYGLMLLKRSNAQLGAGDFAGNAQREEREQPTDVLGSGVACPQPLIEQVLGAGAKLSGKSASSLVKGLLYGQPDTGAAPSEVPRERLHYLCHDTGTFDQGADPANSPVYCPPASRVTFFALDAAAPTDLSNFACQTAIAFPPASGQCGTVLANWERAGFHGVMTNLIWRCRDTNVVYCDAQRDDLLAEKTFYFPEPAAAVFVPLLSEIDDAFRYKTQFKNREGTGIGFAPEVCAKNSSSIPYCYDPQRIEEAASRVDCLMHLSSAFPTQIEPVVRNTLNTFLKQNYSCDGCDREPLPATARDGFERLYAELLVMLGDESYTDALKSRFDLAESGLRTFEGAKFEPGGIDLSGIAGFEMYKLYQAAEYYQLVLDRFYAASPLLWESLKAPATRNFVSQRTVTMYFGKVLRASTQRARAWSEVGKRYQTFNRPDLARRVVERAYTSAYIESIVVARMMQTLVSNPEAVSETERTQVQSEMDRAARTYRAALLDMREVYLKFTDDINYFGYAADYVPLPALDPNGPNAFSNAFESIVAQAEQAIETAAVKEDLALASNRSFDTDSAAFQRELASLKNTYDGQLADVCGTFKGDDGNVYPAATKYAYASERTRTLGSPCGLTGTGKLSEAMAELELVRLDGESVVAAYRRLTGELQTETARISAQCDAIYELADYQWQQAGAVHHLNDQIEQANSVIEGLKGVLEMSKEQAESADCLVIVGVASGTNCATKQLSVQLKKIATFLAQGAIAVEKINISRKEDEIELIERDTMRWVTKHECDMARIESDATMKNLALQTMGLGLDALKVEYRARLALSEIESLRNQATRIEAEQTESEQLSINVEAARNDPNVRIYKNDAVVNADKTFTAALREAYRATKVYEYYTSQSYEGLARLGLVRMVSRGDYNLENYVAELSSAYQGFLETAGRPDDRVEIVSLREDVLRIPSYDDAGRVLSQSERIERFREVLRDPTWLDARGYRVFPFSTTLSRLSPLTRNHEISMIEAEIEGADVGDAIGRVYLAQKGTSLVHALDDSTAFYRLPARTSVVNVFFNGSRVFDPEVYRNDRLRDRPYANSAWELVFNQRDEQANADIDLNTLSDIRLFIHYQDFTEL